MINFGRGGFYMALLILALLLIIAYKEHGNEISLESFFEPVEPEPEQI